MRDRARAISRCRACLGGRSGPHPAGKSYTSPVHQQTNHLPATRSGQLPFLGQSVTLRITPHPAPHLPVAFRLPKLKANSYPYSKPGFMAGIFSWLSSQNEGLARWGRPSTCKMGEWVSSAHRLNEASEHDGRHLKVLEKILRKRYLVGISSVGFFAIAVVLTRFAASDYELQVFDPDRREGVDHRCDDPAVY